MILRTPLSVNEIMICRSRVVLLRLWPKATIRGNDKTSPIKFYDKIFYWFSINSTVFRVLFRLVTGVTWEVLVFP